MPRPLNKLAAAILSDWGLSARDPRKVKPFQRFSLPYVDAMLTLSSLSDYYGVDDAEEIVIRFLCNAAPWRGEVARQVKTELKEHLKEKSCVGYQR